MIARPANSLLQVAAALAAAAWVVAVPVARGVTFPDKPPEEHFYVDEAGIIGEAEASEIDRIAGDLMLEQEIPILVVTISSLTDHGAAGYTIERYAYELFNHWGIGSRQRNYGMLLLVSTGDRRARIELGASWGHAYDAQAQQVMDTLILPPFRRGDYAEGILAGVRGLDAMARGLELPRPPRPWWVLPLMGGLLLVAVGTVVSLFRSGRKGWGWALLLGLVALLFFLLRAAAQSRGSGGAFGGGSSGGGGASGSW